MKTQGKGKGKVIVTTCDGLRHGNFQLPVADGSIDAYFAAPDRPGRAPIILVIQEIFGLHEHIRDICRRFAHVGYLAVAPQLFQRQGDASAYTDNAALARGNAHARESNIHVYQEAGHAFYADYRPGYQAPAAQDGWQRCLAWIARHTRA